MTELQREEDHKEELRDLVKDIQSWTSFLWSKWKLILPIGILGGVLGFLNAHFKTPQYKASLDFVLEDAKGGGGGGLGGLAALAGVNLGGGGGGAFQGDNILELYKSRNMITQALLDEDEQGNLLLDSYMKMQELEEVWKEQPELLNLDFRVPAEARTYQQDSILGTFVKDIKENHLSVHKPDKMLSLIQVEVLSPDENFSKNFTEALVETVNAAYINNRLSKTQKSVNLLQHQVDSVRTELDKALMAVAQARERTPNANPTRMSLHVASAKHEVDAQANEALLKELIKNLELTKMDLRRETPLIQIIDQPVLPLEMVESSRLKSLILGGIIAGILIVGFLITKEYFRRLMHEE